MGRRHRLLVAISSSVVAVWGVMLLFLATSGLSRAGGIALLVGGLFGVLGLLLDHRQRRRQLVVSRTRSEDSR